MVLVVLEVLDSLAALAKLCNPCQNQDDDPSDHPSRRQDSCYCTCQDSILIDCKADNHRSSNIPLLYSPPCNLAVVLVGAIAEANDDGTEDSLQKAILVPSSLHCEGGADSSSDVGTKEVLHNDDNRYASIPAKAAGVYAPAA